MPPSVSIVEFSGSGSGARATAQIGDGRITGFTVTAEGRGYSSGVLVLIPPPTGPLIPTTLWSHDGSSTGGGEPASTLTLEVTKGLYAVGLGDLARKNMTEPITADSLAGQNEVLLRIWFSASGEPGTFELLSPDQKIASTAFALHAAVAESVPDGAIGMDQLASGAISGDKIADGAITQGKISAPGTEQVLVSDGAGHAVWLNLNEFLLSQQYTPPLPGVVENLSTLDIPDVVGDVVQIVNGPGFAIEDLGGTPGNSGLNTEFSIVFDYDGPDNATLQDWFDTPTPRSGSIIVKNTIGDESYRWNFFGFQLSTIAPGGGNGGRNRTVVISYDTTTPAPP